MITPSAVAAVCAIVFGASVLQRTVGFGFALLAVPLLTFAVAPKSAVVIALLDGTATSAWIAVDLRRAIVPEATRRLGLGVLLGVPLGAVVLRAISPDALQALVGVTTCLAAVWIIVSSRLGGTGPDRAPRWRTVTLGFASGVLATSVATSGPPVVYELRRRGLDGDAFRATATAVLFIGDLFGIPALAVAGLLPGSTVLLAAISLVPCAVGIGAGAWISARLEASHFVWAADLLLLATGIATVVRALV